VASLDVNEFKAALQAAITARETHYSTLLAFHFHWEDDEMKLMGFNAPDVY
jgi:hypothetical protein